MYMYKQMKYLQCYGVCVQCDEIAIDDDNPKK